MELTLLIEEFKKTYHKLPEKIFFCPGRVNLIGEHIDYNGGNVLPCAITMGTWLAVAKNTEKVIRFQSFNFQEQDSLHLQESYSKTGAQWFNYPLGVLNEFLKDNINLSGLDLFFYGNLPVGAGLSSSASIEVLMAYAISNLFGVNKDGKEIALLAKKVENEFIGVNCGIMDQFAVAMGKKGNAILLNCDTLDYEYFPFHSEKYSLTIINTNKQRKLVDSKYNERFAECRNALALLQKKLSVSNLCEISPASFELTKLLIENEVVRRRAQHVISENQRVKDAVLALQMNDWEIFGKLMYASHQSLQVDYEVSGIELDTIIDFCKSFAGCIGARMTGAGFGGCAVALVAENKLDDFKTKLIKHYQTIIGYTPDVFLTSAEDGVKEIAF